MNVFDIVKGINQKKELPEWEELEDVYVPWLVNKALSFDRRTVLWANEANKLHQLEKRMQFDLLVNGVDKITRPGMWIKAEKLDGVMEIAKKYSCGLQEALMLRRLISQEELAEIIAKYK